MSKKYTFTEADYLKSKIRERNIDIPESVIQTIKNIICEKKITNINRINIKHILCETNNIEYLPNIDKILSLINNPISVVDDTECVICFETINEIIILQCKHAFCESCSNMICNNNKLVCPLCRNTQNFSKNEIINDDRMKQILIYFNKHKDEYIHRNNKPGRYIPFSTIIDDINKKIDIEIITDKK